MAAGEGVPATVAALSLAGVALAVIALSVPPAERRVVFGIFGAACGLRLLTATLVYHWNRWFFSLDQGGYFPRGAALAAQWREAGGGPSLSWLHSGPGNHFIELWATLSYFVKQ
jgi:hypothetical protein